MKRVALSIMMIASLLFAGAVPAMAGDSELLANLVQLADGKLSDSDLAAVSGRGTLHRTGQAEAERVIIWDEGPVGGVVSHHNSTGYGGTQSSTVSINGR
jgi:hypothetical protein